MEIRWNCPFTNMEYNQIHMRRETQSPHISILIVRLSRVSFVKQLEVAVPLPQPRPPLPCKITLLHLGLFFGIFNSISCGEKHQWKHKYISLSWDYTEYEYLSNLTIFCNSENQKFTNLDKLWKNCIPKWKIKEMSWAHMSMFRIDIYKLFEMARVRFPARTCQFWVLQFKIEMILVKSLHRLCFRIF